MGETTVHRHRLTYYLNRTALLFETTMVCWSAGRGPNWIAFHGAMFFLVLFYIANEDV